MPGRQNFPKTLLIGCGALAREMVELIRVNGLSHMSVTCLPAIWHNRPERIPEGVRGKIREARGRFDRILVLYGDCGTGGELDRVLAEEGVERIDGPHCYAFFSGLDGFLGRAEDEIDCFYLTDYLARHFDRLIIQGLGLDRHPELLPLYFGNYRAVVYLAQTEDPELQAKAEAAAAQKLGLAYEYRFTGYGELAASSGRRTNEVGKRFAEDGQEKEQSMAQLNSRLLARHPGPGDRQGGPQERQASARRALREGDRPGGHEGQAARYGLLSRRVAPRRAVVLRRRPRGRGERRPRVSRPSSTRPVWPGSSRAADSDRRGPARAW